MPCFGLRARAVTACELGWRRATVAGTQRRGLRPELMILLLLVVAVPIIGWQIYRRVTFQFNELVTALTAHPCAFVYKDKKEYDLLDLSRSKSTCSTYDAVRLGGGGVCRVLWTRQSRTFCLYDKAAGARGTRRCHAGGRAAGEQTDAGLALCPHLLFLVPPVCARSPANRRRARIITCTE